MNTEYELYPGVLAEKIITALNWVPVNSQVAVASGFRCEYCGLDMLQSLEAYFSWQIDQIQPAGGYTPENCALACRTCNHLKHSRRPNGATREEKIADAWDDIQRKRVERQAELDQLRQLIGYAGAEHA